MKSHPKDRIRPLADLEGFSERYVRASREENMFRYLFARNGRSTSANSPAHLDEAYRRHLPGDEERFTSLARRAFPDFADRIACFGADWLGRQFATDRKRLIGGRPQVLMLEPGTGEALEIPADIDTFHGAELVQHAEAAVALSFFGRWLASGGKAPSYDRCVGYKVPLFLGGADEVENLQISDMDVYWTISAELLAKVRGLPVGTRINSVVIDD